MLPSIKSDTYAPKVTLENRLNTLGLLVYAYILLLLFTTNSTQTISNELFTPALTNIHINACQVAVCIPRRKRRRRGEKKNSANYVDIVSCRVYACWMLHTFFDQSQLHRNRKKSINEIMFGPSKHTHTYHNQWSSLYCVVYAPLSW